MISKDAVSVYLISNIKHYFDPRRQLLLININILLIFEGSDRGERL